MAFFLSQRGELPAESMDTPNMNVDKVRRNLFISNIDVY